MIKILKLASKPNLWNISRQIQIKTFLTPSYYCEEVWANRLNSPLLQKVNLDQFYHDLDQKYQSTRQISAVDVDIFANALHDDLFVDELLDLIHKLRLNSETSSTLESTGHATIRCLLKFNKTEDLLNVLDDRLNYGLFLDGYMANILLDYFWKKNDFVGGCRTASQLMFQEDFEHPVATCFSLLHCYTYLLQKTGEWPKYPQPQEPDEEVKIRVKYLRNPYDDEHFCLREPNKIIGKTLMLATNGGSTKDVLNRSLNIIGLALFNKEELLNRSIEDCIKNNINLYKEIIDFMPENNERVKDLKTVSGNIQELLKDQLRIEINKNSEHDIVKQCKIYQKWELDRIEALEKQTNRLLTAKRLRHIENVRNALEEKETKLWFFENEEQIELALEKHDKEQNEIKKNENKTIVNEDNYIPPEAIKKVV